MKILAYYKICQFSVNYESLVFYRTGPWANTAPLPGKSNWRRKLSTVDLLVLTTWLRSVNFLIEIVIYLLQNKVP